METLKSTLLSMESSSTNLVVLTENNQQNNPLNPLTDLKIVIGNQEANNTLAVTWDAFGKGIAALSAHYYSGVTVSEVLSFQEKKDKLFLTAVDNLIKKNDFLQLTIQLDQELIDDEEFSKELEKNESKYLITMNEEYNESDYFIITEILPKLNRQFSVDEVSELFSIPMENINTFLDTSTK